MQSLSDKCQGIISLLELVFLHRDFVPGAARTQRQEWVSEPSPLDEPRPVVVITECNARCDTCLAYHERIGRRPQCPDEKWLRERLKLRRCYRIADVECSLLKLAKFDISQAQAVWAVFVEPWPGELVDIGRPSLGTRTEAISPQARHERADLADAGVFWLAEDIDGDVLPVGEVVHPVDNEIRRLLAYGVAERRIARDLGVGRDRIRRIKRAQTVRCER